MSYAPESIIIPVEHDDDDGTNGEEETGMDLVFSDDDGERLPLDSAISRTSPMDLVRQTTSILNRLTAQNYDLLAPRLLVLVDGHIQEDDPSTSNNGRSRHAPGHGKAAPTTPPIPLTQLARRRVVELIVWSAVDNFPCQSLFTRLTTLLHQELSPHIWQESSPHHSHHGGELFQEYLISCLKNLLASTLAYVRDFPEQEGQQGQKAPSNNPTHHYSASTSSIPYRLTESDPHVALRYLSSFVCELYIHRVVPEGVIHHFIRRLLFPDSSKDDVETPLSVVCAICEMFEFIGSNLDSSQRGRGIMDYYFEHLQELLNCMDPFLRGRARFLLLNVIDLRERNWNFRTYSESLPQDSPDVEVREIASDIPPVADEYSVPPPLHHEFPLEEAKTPRDHSQSFGQVDDHRSPTGMGERLSAHPSNQFEPHPHHPSYPIQVTVERQEGSSSPDSQFAEVDPDRPPVLVRGTSFEFLRGAPSRRASAAFVSNAMSPILSAGASVTSNEAGMMPPVLMVLEQVARQQQPRPPKPDPIDDRSCSYSPGNRTPSSGRRTPRSKRSVDDGSVKQAAGVGGGGGGGGDSDTLASSPQDVYMQKGFNTTPKVLKEHDDESVSIPTPEVTKNSNLANLNGHHRTPLQHAHTYPSSRQSASHHPHHHHQRPPPFHPHKQYLQTLVDAYLTYRKTDERERFVARLVRTTLDFAVAESPSPTTVDVPSEFIENRIQMAKAASWMLSRIYDMHSRAGESASAKRILLYGFATGVSLTSHVRDKKITHQDGAFKVTLALLFFGARFTVEDLSTIFLSCSQLGEGLKAEMIAYMEVFRLQDNQFSTWREEEEYHDDNAPIHVRAHDSHQRTTPPAEGEKRMYRESTLAAVPMAPSMLSSRPHRKAVPLDVKDVYYN